MSASLFPRAVVFTVHRRPHYLAETLQSWARVRGLEGWLFGFAVEPSDQLSQVLDVVHDLAPPNSMVTVNDECLGVLRNPWNLLDRAFQNWGCSYVVLAEEDVIVSEDVLEYHDWASRQYATDATVLAVCSFTRHEGQGDAVVRSTGFSPLVWGTWVDRWAGVLRDTWDLDYSTGVDGKQAGWDWNLNLRVIPQHGLSVITPLSSRSNHIGEHEGVHMRPCDYDSSRSLSFRADREPVAYVEMS